MLIWRCCNASSLQKDILELIVTIFFYEFIISFCYQDFIVTSFLIIFSDSIWQNYQGGQQKNCKLVFYHRKKCFWGSVVSLIIHSFVTYPSNYWLIQFWTFFEFFLLALLQKLWRKKSLSDNTQYLHLVIFTKSRFLPGFVKIWNYTREILPFSLTS